MAHSRLQLRGFRELPVSNGSQLSVEVGFRWAGGSYQNGKKHEETKQNDKIY